MGEPVLSLVYPYFKHRVTFLYHLSNWADLPEKVQAQVEFVIVDDASPSPLQRRTLEGMFDSTIMSRVRIFRVRTPIIWNYGAKNLGVYQARADWVLLSELDHVAGPWTIEHMVDLVQRATSRGCYYSLHRRNMHPAADKRYSDRPHLATYLIHQDDFWKAGGIDEDFSGAYGYDDQYLHECLAHQGVRKESLSGVVLKNISDGHEFDDADLKRDPNIPRDLKRNARLLGQKQKTMQVSRPQLRFSWEEVTW